MITDSLTCRPQENPRRSRAPLPLLVPCFLARTKAPAIHAAQHERAGRAGCSRERGRLYRRHTRDSPAGGTAILHAQDSAKSRKITHVDAARASQPRRV